MHKIKEIIVKFIEKEKSFKDHSKPRSSRSAWMVRFYAFVCAVTMLLQCFLNTIPFIVQHCGECAFLQHLNTNLSLPLEEMSILWITIASAYIGIDRAAFATKSSQMCNGSADFGDSYKIRSIVYLSFFLFLFSTLMNVIVKGDYFIKNYAVAFGVSVSLYVGGQKMIRVTQNIDVSKHKGCEKPEEKTDLPVG